MKTLLLMRHAKADSRHSRGKDRERPLNKRGKRNAPLMANLIKDKELIPQLILSSSAERAKQTAEIVAELTDYKGEVRMMDKLYMAEWDTLIDVLRKLDNDLERVMIVGHNPGLESLLPLLTGQVMALPTAAIAHLVLPIERWKDLNKKTKAELVELWRPKELEGREESEDREEREEHD